MLTPRHQALLATLAGMTVGVAVFGTVLAINRDTTSDTSGGVRNTPSASIPTTPLATPTTPSGPAGLQADGLRYTLQTFGTDNGTVSVEVPEGWKSSQTGARPRFLDPTGIWQVRFDTRGSKHSPAQLVKTRVASIDEQDLEVLSRDHGTLVYTYTDKTRGPRMGLSRWLPADNGNGSAIEITVGGRPQDEGGLRAVLDRATETVNVPVTPSVRPN
jgi:hypothetical protein